MTTKCGCGGVKTPPYRRAGTERLPDKGRYPQGCPSSGPAGPPSPAGEGLGAGEPFGGWLPRGYGRGKYLLAHRAEKLYTDIIIMYGWNEP